MHLSSCEHPVRVYNKYIDDYVWTDCRKCNTCLNKRAFKWIKKLEQEKKCWQYCFMIFLSYSDKWIPRYLLNGCELVEAQPRFSIKDNYHVIDLESSFFKNLDEADKEYFITLINSERGLNHASVIDIQKFKKRFNKHCHDNYTHQYQNFRSFIVAEYGPTTFRGHYHGIFFFNSSEIAQNFEKILHEVWQFGDCSASEVRSNKGIEYVAQYVNCTTHLPACYAHPALKPFSLYSKQPPLGSLFESTTEIREIFRSGSCRRVEFVKTKTGDIEPSIVPLLPSLEHRLFPKCPQYCNISSSLRMQLYGCAIQESSEPCHNGYEKEYETFEEFANDLINKYTVPDYKFDIFYVSQLPSNLQDYFISDSPIDSENELFSLYKNITNDFSPDSYSCLLNLYRMSKRVLAQCRSFNCTLDYYVSRIELHYDLKDKLNIRDMYRFQEAYKGNPDDLQFMYPEHVYQTQPNSCLEDCEEFAKMKAQSAYIREESTKTMKKNAYLESLSVKDTFLFNLIKNYHAKKRNEIVKAFA